MEYIAELRATISRLHKCEASHSRTEAVKQVVNGQVMWEGNVEAFALLGHDNALRCYAWGHLHDDGKWEVTTVLAIPPVVSAESAVLAAFIARVKEREHEKQSENGGNEGNGSAA
ncbi:MAG: hypothetical protein V4773_01745 [Verrucomicrobiota bacterium]